LADSVAKVGCTIGLAIPASVEIELVVLWYPGFWLGRGGLQSEPRRGSYQLGQPSQVLGDRRQRELVLHPSGSTQTKLAEPQDALEVGEPLFYAFALVPRPLESFGPGRGSGDIAEHSSGT
jgi:hypothetical protein